MIAQSDLLLSIAQISIAFAGFAGVIAAFSKFKLHPEATAFRVRLLVTASLSTMLFSLLPGGVALFGVSEETAWRICSGVMGLVGFIFPFWAVRRARQLYKAGILHTQAMTFFVNIAGAAITIALFANAAGPVAQLAPAIYVSALLFTLFLCSYYFVMQIFAIELGGDD